VSRLGVSLFVSLVVTALVAPGAIAHGVDTVAGHAAEDAVIHTAAQERALDAHTRSVGLFPAMRAAVAVAGDVTD